ncbi:MAG: replication initiator protein A [Oscillospiraceae bacterium]
MLQGGNFTENLFYKLPQALFSEKYRNISNDGKLLYCLMLDRVKLSEKNNWRDGHGRVYIIFTRDEACQTLGFGKDKAARVYSELESAGLIEQKKQYLARPTLIYVNAVVESSDVGCGDIQKSEKTVSEGGESGVQDDGDGAAINTYPNQNKNSQLYNIKTYPSQSEPSDVTGVTNTADLIEQLNEMLEFELLKARYPLSEGTLEEMRDIIAEVILHRRKVTYEGKPIPADYAAERFGKLTSDNICLVLDSLAQTESDIRRIDAYIATALYVSTFTVSSRNAVGIKLP